MTFLGTTRIVDLDEIERLLEPYTFSPHKHPGAREISLSRPDNQVSVRATVRCSGRTRAEIRAGAVENGNAAIAAIEAAGYEHVAAPEIRIGGIEVTPLNKLFDYLVDAELTMELIGKPS